MCCGHWSAESATNPLTRIAAAIYCERPGQKAILIGKGGAKLKEIGAGARKEIESLLGTRVYLELHAKVKGRWRESQPFVEGLDWRRQLEDLEAKKREEQARCRQNRIVTVTGTIWRVRFWGRIRVCVFGRYARPGRGCRRDGRASTGRGEESLRSWWRRSCGDFARARMRTQAGKRRRERRITGRSGDVNGACGAWRSIYPSKSAAM
ncbi:MAG: KH domain-containing protein [Acidobacteriaceae bacterium]